MAAILENTVKSRINFSRGILRNPSLQKQAASLREKLRAFSFSGLRTKQAVLGGDPENSFEQAFANLAYTYIKDKAPRLLDYMVGFQLVDRNEDNTKAIGIFGFRLGQQWAYAPVFFLNSDLKGHELLYLKGQDVFVPLKENWINYLLNKKPHILGESSNKTLQQLGVLQPNLRALSMPPNHSKYGSVQLSVPAGWSDWATEILPQLGGWVLDNPRQKYAELDTRLNVPNLMAKSLGLTKQAMQICEQYPEIGRLCRHYYGHDFIKRALLELRKAATQPQQSPSVLGDYRWPQFKQAAGPAVDIRVQDSITLTQNLPELTEAEQERLLRDGVLIRDYRNGEEVSKAYNVQIAAELVNPDASGIYDVLVRPGEFEELLVVNEPHTARGKQDFATVIRASGEKDWLNCHRTRLWARPDRKTREEQSKWLEERNSTSVRTGGTYIVLCRSAIGTLEGSTPFTVREDLGDGRYRVTWHDWNDRQRPTYLRLSPRETGPFSGENYERDRDFYGSGDILWLNRKKGSQFRSQQGQLLVPEDAKVLTISDPDTDTVPKPGEMVYEGPCAYSKKNPINPGDLADVQIQILQKTAGLKLWTDGHEISINSGPLRGKRAGLIELVRDYGFREKTARHLIRQAELNHYKGKPAVFRIKYAVGYPMMGGGPGAPAIPPQEYGIDPSYGGVQTVNPQTFYQGIPEMSAGLTDPSVYDTSPEQFVDPNIMQVAQQAGQQGQKEVFDTAIMAGLLRSQRQDNLIEKDMGDLMKALDRLGSILFKFYWHNNEFSDRYGKSDMPELEDTLRNAFEIVGDLVLFLREKDATPMPGKALISPTVDNSGE